MAHGSWLEEFPGAITVCDARGIILGWYANGIFAGLVELSLELPETLPHFVRGA
jgi:hypothetical protein